MTAILPHYEEKPPKSKRDRERDTVERDLIFDDLSQDYEVLMYLTELKRKLELAKEKNQDPVVGMLLESALDDVLPKLKTLEDQDVNRHHTRASIFDFKRRVKPGQPAPPNKRNGRPGLDPRDGL